MPATVLSFCALSATTIVMIAMIASTDTTGTTPATALTAFDAMARREIPMTIGTMTTFKISRSSAVAQENMVITVEPGIYLPGEMGVRIEDLALVTEDGVEILNHLPKALEVLP